MGSAISLENSNSMSFVAGTPPGLSAPAAPTVVSSVDGPQGPQADRGLPVALVHGASFFDHAFSTYIEDIVLAHAPVCACACIVSCS